MYVYTTGMTTNTLSRSLPQVTPEQCFTITGNDRNHAAHKVFTTRAGDARRRVVTVPIAVCPGRHEYTPPVQNADPFFLIEAEDDREA